MSQFYTIKDVKKGNEWQNSFGTFQSYSLSLEGLGEPVSLNKAVPVKDEPQTGQQLYGSVELMQSQKGTTYQKFKTEKVPDDEYTAPSPQNQPQGSYEGHSDKEDSIARAVALKAAVETPWANPPSVNEVLVVADKFVAWLKGSSESTNPKAGQTDQPELTTTHTTTEPSGYDKAKQARDNLNQDPEVQSLMDFADGYSGEDDES